MSPHFTSDIIKIIYNRLNSQNKSEYIVELSNILQNYQEEQENVLPEKDSPLIKPSNMNI
jgi:predicted subunit of tRNA(5-methylaminomethyl-2-thiouridylate) methyltransferase